MPTDLVPPKLGDGVIVAPATDSPTGITIGMVLIQQAAAAPHPAHHFPGVLALNLATVVAAVVPGTKVAGRLLVSIAG